MIKQPKRFPTIQIGRYCHFRLPVLRKQNLYKNRLEGKGFPVLPLHKFIDHKQRDF